MSTVATKSANAKVNNRKFGIGIIAIFVILILAIGAMVWRYESRNSTSNVVGTSAGNRTVSLNPLRTMMKQSTWTPKTGLTKLHCAAMDDEAAQEAAPPMPSEPVGTTVTATCLYPSQPGEVAQSKTDYDNTTTGVAYGFYVVQYKDFTTAQNDLKSYSTDNYVQEGNNVVILAGPSEQVASGLISEIARRTGA